MVGDFLETPIDVDDVGVVAAVGALGELDQGGVYVVFCICILGCFLFLCCCCCFVASGNLTIYFLFFVFLLCVRL